MSGPDWTPSPELVDDVREALSAAPVGDPVARFERLSWIALLDQFGGALLTRALAPAHLTASAVVLCPEGTHTCLVLHRKLQLWVQPGGHFEPGDTSATMAAAREVAEETGLHGTVLAAPALLSRHRAPCAPGVVDWHLDLEFVLVSERTTPRPSDETPQVAWWPLEDLPSNRAHGTDQLVAGGLAALELSRPGRSRPGRTR